MTSNTGKDAKKLDYSYITDKNEKWYTTQEKSMAISHKTKHVLVILLPIALSGTDPPKKITYVNTKTCT